MKALIHNPSSISIFDFFFPVMLDDQNTIKGESGKDLRKKIT